MSLRLITFVAAVAALAIALFASPAGMMAAGAAGGDAPSPAAQEGPPAQVDDNDDTRVEVQLAVLGAAAVIVVVFGGVGYLIRRRLGLDKPPEQGAPGHH